jgi:hypothetical protein
MCVDIDTFPYSGSCNSLLSLLNTGWRVCKRGEQSCNQCLSTECAEYVYIHSSSDASSIQLSLHTLGTAYWEHRARQVDLHFLIIIKCICIKILTRSVWMPMSYISNIDTLKPGSLFSIILIYKSIVTHTPIARQRFGKHFPKHTLSTIEGHSFWGNRWIKTHSWKQKTVFSMEYVQRSYKRSQSGVQRSTREYNGVVEFSSVGSQNSSSGVSCRKKMAVCQIVICELL